MTNKKHNPYDFIIKDGQNMWAKINWKWLCGKCKKKYLKNVMPIAKRYIKNHPNMSMRAVSRYYGIPHSTFHDAIQKAL